MLCRVSCEACSLSCLWTDDPKAFLESVCLRYRRCQAKLVYEEFSSPVGPPKGRARATSATRLARLKRQPHREAPFSASVLPEALRPKPATR